MTMTAGMLACKIQTNKSIALEHETRQHIIIDHRSILLGDDGVIKDIVGVPRNVLETTSNETRMNVGEGREKEHRHQPV